MQRSIFDPTFASCAHMHHFLIVCPSFEKCYFVFLETKKHACEICGHRVKRRGDLKYHMVKHTGTEWLNIQVLNPGGGASRPNTQVGADQLKISMMGCFQ